MIYPKQWCLGLVWKAFVAWYVSAMAFECMPAWAATLPPAPAPNIIFILADDLGYTDLGCYGQKEIHTPNIDRLAREGIRLLDCYSAPVCTPSRCMLMTGKNLGGARIRSNVAFVGGTIDATGRKRVSLAADDLIIASCLRDAGYATAITGKWGLGEPATTGLPTLHGFDEWFGYLNDQRATNYYPEYLWKNENRIRVPENSNGRKAIYAHDLFTKFALDFVRKHKNAPFFLYLPYTIPHFKLESPDLGEYSEKNWPEKAKAYAAMISRLDRDVGRLMRELSDLGIDRNTVVFFASDNGAMKKPFGDMFHSWDSFRGTKSTLYEGGIRVPMIVRWPGVIAAGSQSDQPLSFVDIFPTLCAIARIPKPAEELDGCDIMPLLEGREYAGDSRIFYWEFPQAHPKPFLWQAVRMGRWKGLRFGHAGKFELYDIVADHSESTDVARLHPDIVEAMSSYMDKQHTPSPYWPVD